MSDQKNVEKGAVVSIDYTLKDDSGAVLDTSEGGQPLQYLHGHGQIIDGLESALEGRELGATVHVDVAPADGYGDHDPERLVEVPKDQFEFDVQVGDFVRAQHPDGSVIPFKVAAVEENSVTLDGNHPLAGQSLHFDVTVVEIRPATDEEIEHGHVHGDGEHEHGHGD